MHRIGRKSSAENLIYLLKGLFSLGYNSVSKILPSYLTSITSSAASIGLVSSSYQLARGVGGLLLGHASDRLGRKKSLAIAAAFTIALCLLLFFAKTISDFALIFFGIGLFATLFYFSLDALATILNERKAHALSMLEAAYQVGFIAGPAIGGYLAYTMGIQAAFLFWVLSGIACLFAVRMLKCEENGKNAGLRSFLSHMRLSFASNFKPALALGAFAPFSVGLAEGFRDLAIPLYATYLGFDIFSVGAIFAISAAITAVGVVPFGKFSDSKGRSVSLMAGMALIAASSLLLIFFNSFLSLALLTGVYSLGRTAGFISFRAFSSDITSDEHRAGGFSISEIFFSSGKVCGPLAAGILLDAYGAPLSFAFVAVLALLSAAIFACAKDAKIKRSP